MRQHRDKSRWIVAGSSLSASMWLRYCVGKWPDAATVSCNRSVKMFRDGGLDALILIDAVAHRLFFGMGADAREQHGTHLVTLQDFAGDYDEYIPASRTCTPANYTPEGYSHVPLTGLYAMQYALLNGAKIVHVVGMEGYGGSDPKDVEYFDGSIGDAPDMATKTKYIIAPWMNAFLREWPQVQFYFYGCMNYQLDGLNVELHGNSPELRGYTGDEAREYESHMVRKW